ncbi:MAG: tetratricopeptide repeat protein [Lactobacillus sp.]|nr:tetratricopeptide repeat protein [Lactobacillus sp.]
MPRTFQGEYVTEASKVFQEGDDLWHAGQYDDAREAYQKSAKLYDDNEDNEGEAFALNRLGELELSLDNYDRALMVLDTAAGLIKDEEHAQNTYGDTLIKLSKVFTSKGDIAKAIKMIREAQKVLDNIANYDLLGDAHDHEAFIHLTQNKEGDALEAYKKAAECYAKERIELKEASTLRAIVRIYMKNKRYDEAHDLLERCRDLYRENGDLLGEASALSAIGTLRYVIGDIGNARKALMKSVYLYGKVSHHFAEAEALLYLARVESFNKEQGDFERAKAHYKRSIELFDFLGNEVMKQAALDEYEIFVEKTGKTKEGVSCRK